VKGRRTDDGQKKMTEGRTTEGQHKDRRQTKKDDGRADDGEQKGPALLNRSLKELARNQTSEFMCKLDIEFAGSAVRDLF
jgi:hypothetical protein